MRVHGLDYGVVPRMMLLGDVEFAHVLGAAGVDAIGYGVLPQHGVLVDAPLVYPVVRESGRGREAFARLRRWMEGPDGTSSSSDGVGVEFVETSDGGYALTLYPSPDYIVDRMVAEHLRPEVEPIPIAGAFMKSFPVRSEHYRTFRRVAEGRPYVFALGDFQGNVFLDEAIVKREGVFFREGDPASFRGQLDIAPGPPEEGPPPSPADIAERRRRRLREHFHVTRTRLPWSTAYREAVGGLGAAGVREWQVEQAACTLALRNARPELFAGETVSEVDLIDAVVGGIEEAGVRAPLLPLDAFDADTLGSQVEADARRLVALLGGREPGPALSDVQSALSTFAAIDA